MADYATIYREYADQYERLVTYEDYELNLPRALEQIRSFNQADVIELGAGTGRVTLFYAAHARSIVAGDREPSMLKFAYTKLAALHRSHWRTVIADNRHLPLPDQIADISIAGWSIGHMQHWYPDTWRSEIDQIIHQMRRVLRPTGTIIIIETLGTGSTEPSPPHERLAAYYQMLEQEYGFASTAIRTDYKFDSVQQASEVLGFFFGDEFAAWIIDRQSPIVPECTGLWWRTK